MNVIARQTSLVLFIASLFTIRVMNAGASQVDLEAVERILVSKCLKCHSGSEPASGLDLTQPDLAVREGLAELSLLESTFWEKIEFGEMPPDRGLTPDELKFFRDWLAAGGKWDSHPIDPLRLSTPDRAGRDWWAFQSLTDPIPPPAAETNPIDRFVAAALKDHGLSWNPEASARTLIRRLYFDLVGLPPPIEVVETFENNPSEQAYLEIVDRLLASPDYGERWARHWLDLVRFGESDGFERNAPRENLWPYRDWVIRAMNRDMPYTEFVQRQLAGDSTLQDPLEIAAAQGYLVAGVHNTVVGTSRTMQLLARQDELEDLIGNVGQTFLGLTLNCARCHDHKFDPVTQVEYYQLVASLNGVSHGSRSVRSSEDQAKLDQMQALLNDAKDQLRQIERPVLAALTGQPDPNLSAPVFDFLASSPSHPNLVWHGDPRFEDGALVLDGRDDYVEVPLSGTAVREKTFEVCLKLPTLEQQGGAAMSLETGDGSEFDAIVYAELQPARWMAGSNFFRRTKSFEGDSETVSREELVHLAITYQADGTVRCFRNGLIYGQSYRTEPPPEFRPGGARILIGLRHSPPAAGKFLAAKILRARLFDRSLTEAEIAAAAHECGAGVSDEMIASNLTEPQRNRWRALSERVRQWNVEIDRLTQAGTRSVYTQTSITPDAVPFLPRGDVTKPGRNMRAGTTQACSGSLDSTFDLPDTAGDLERRAALAAWITDSKNPLFHRTIVNRLWQFHFGAGFVPTASDLGFHGGQPSHPELLDWLCRELQRNEYRLKPMHRLIVTSRAWKQSAAVQPQGLEQDVDNRWLWRKSPTRLEAEVIRDSMLAITGKLNPMRGGPGFRDVAISDSGNGTTYYAEFDQEISDLNRRTIYRFSPRGGRPALLDSLDCPDASTSTPKRTITTTPLQSLSLLNSPFVLRMCDAFAERAEVISPDRTAQVNWMFRAIYSRPALEWELTAGRELADRHGLASLARALFNSSEFVTIF